MRLIDADEIIDFLKRDKDECDELYKRESEHVVLGMSQEAEVISEVIKKTPEAVVRCKDCKYWAEFTFNIPPFNYCGRLFQDGNTESIGFYMEADDFCSKGINR